MDLQKMIDDLVAKNPTVEKFVSGVHYVKQGATPPPGSTHLLKLTDLGGNEVVVALTIRQPYATLINFLLPIL